METQLKSLEEKIEILAKTLDRFYEDFRDDRRMRGEMQITLQTMANKTDATRDDLADQHKETGRVVEDAIKETIKPIQDKVDKLTSSKNPVVHYIEDKRKHGIQWMFWK